MANGHLKAGTADRLAVFDLFFREGDATPFAVAAGLEQAVEFIKNIRFASEEIEYLQSLNLFCDEFFERLKNFKFGGDVFAMREGEIVFPMQPILTVRASLFEAQLLETALLNIINHQTLIATKTMRIVNEAGAPVAEFGLRRAQAPDAGIYGSRAAIIGGAASTSNVLAGQMFGIKVTGTMAHSFVMSFDSELTAFRQYAKIYPQNCTLIVDTYDTLKSGVPNAITVFKELQKNGFKPLGIRLDSGDLAYLSKTARKMLDEAGLNEVKIFASGDIDENVLTALRMQGAKIDAYGIGTKLITAEPRPALGGVYKLAGICDESGKFVPKMKKSDSTVKITNPAFKTVYRIYKADKMAAADLIALRDESIDFTKPLTIFHPVETWKRKTFECYTVKELPVQIFKKGELVYALPTLSEIVAYAQKSKQEFWCEYLRLANPHIYKVDLSQALFDLKAELLNS
jgi:nicotinate phosphoribosyltransferase